MKKSQKILLDDDLYDCTLKIEPETTYLLIAEQLLAKYIYGDVNKSLKRCKKDKLEPDIALNFEIYKFNHKSMLGYTKNHKYAIKIYKLRGEYTYMIRAVYDFTTHKIVDLYLPTSSTISFDTMFSK